MSHPDSASIVLIYPPVATPSEPPAGIARIAGALRSYGIRCATIDANIEGLHFLLDQIQPPEDTWSQRAFKHLPHHIKRLRTLTMYQHLDQYRRAVADIGRLLALIDRYNGIRVGLSDYHDKQLSPVRSADLVDSFKAPERNPYYQFYDSQLLSRIAAMRPDKIGISINFLSQALCGFALAGLLKRTWPQLAIILGGGLITSWMQGSGKASLLSSFTPDMVDQFVGGPGELYLLKDLDQARKPKLILPDYSDLKPQPYLSPGHIFGFSASDGCWWRRCAFCPEQAEKRPFTPLPMKPTTQLLRNFSLQDRPEMIHFLDNAISPALLKALVAKPPAAPWYGFVRIGAPLDDPDFCHRLAASGCLMLKLGLESGSQKVLDQLDKGICLSKAARVLTNLSSAGILTYVYLLFGTPAEDQASAFDTLKFVSAHHQSISFLNLAIFNLPINSPNWMQVKTRSFYDGDLALYQDFVHPKGWNRAAVRRFLAKHFKKEVRIRPILHRDPPIFTSNHAPFFSERVSGQSKQR